MSSRYVTRDQSLRADFPLLPKAISNEIMEKRQRNGANPDGAWIPNEIPDVKCRRDELRQAM